MVGRDTCPGVFLKGDRLLTWTEAKPFIKGSKATEVCTLLNTEKAHVIFVDVAPVGLDKYTYDKKIQWPAYYTIMCLQIRLQLSQVVTEFKGKPEGEFTCRLLGMIEPFMARGLAYKSWLED